MASATDEKTRRKAGAAVKIGMQHGWLTKTIGGRRIEHIPCPNVGAAVDESAPPTGVIHTIEGSLESGLAVFRQHYAPHFTLDGERIVQLVPLGTMAAALENHPGGVETNAVARVQIEIAGRSRDTSWVCDEAETETLADLLATLVKTAGIPLERPFPDELPAKPWATYDFARRRAGKWGRVAGWYGHIDVPENAHWDPGAFQWSSVLTRARKIAGTGGKVRPDPTREVPPKRLPAWYWRWLNWLLGEGEFKQYGRRNRAHRPGDAPTTIPAWAWIKAGQFSAARKGPRKAAA